jgi:hypothetical protein
MKFQRATEFTPGVPPDLTTATLYKYMVLRLLFPLHSWHCYVQTESNTARRHSNLLGGNRREAAEGNNRSLFGIRGIVSDFVRALNGATEVKMARVSGMILACLRCHVIPSTTPSRKFDGVTYTCIGLDGCHYIRMSQKVLPLHFLQKPQSIDHWKSQYN